MNVVEEYQNCKTKFIKVFSYYKKNRNRLRMMNDFTLQQEQCLHDLNRLWTKAKDGDLENLWSVKEYHTYINGYREDDEFRTLWMDYIGTTQELRVNVM